MARAASLSKQSTYNARVDRLDAIRLLKALVAAGAKPRAPMASAWIDEIAVRDVSLHGTQLASALAYAKGQRWLADSRTRKDWIYLTRAGEVVAKPQQKESAQETEESSSDNGPMLGTPEQPKPVSCYLPAALSAILVTGNTPQERA